jgi:hypothetical protein
MIKMATRPLKIAHAASGLECNLRIVTLMCVAVAKFVFPVLLSVAFLVVLSSVFLVLLSAELPRFC